MSDDDWELQRNEIYVRVKRGRYEIEIAQSQTDDAGCGGILIDPDQIEQLVGMLEAARAQIQGMLSQED